MNGECSFPELRNRYLVEVDEAITAYFPLGVLSTGDAVLIDSGKTARAARKWSRIVEVVQCLAVVLAFATAGRILFPWPVAVGIDVAVMATMRFIALRRARKWGTSIPPRLSRRMYAEALGRLEIEKQQVASVVGLILIGSATLAMFFGNQPVVMSLFITVFIVGIDCVVSVFRLAAALPRDEIVSNEMEEFRAVSHTEFKSP